MANSVVSTASCLAAAYNRRVRISQPGIRLNRSDCANAPSYPLRLRADFEVSINQMAPGPRLFQTEVSAAAMASTAERRHEEGDPMHMLIIIPLLFATDWYFCRRRLSRRLEFSAATPGSDAFSGVRTCGDAPAHPLGI
jgi:hypothetical protein